jgi:predicted ATPase
VFEAMLHVFMRQYEKAETVAIPAIELADKYQLPQVSAGSRCLLGIAQAYLGHASKGATLIKQGLAEISNMNMKLLAGMFMGFLAAAQERDGSNSSALESIEQALGASEDEVFYRPEILRIRGELRQKLNQQSAAEADFRAAIQLANGICAKAWELRATTSLARLIIEQARRDEAQKILAPIYNWFTEGFDTADLKDAKALLDELSS